MSSRQRLPPEGLATILTQARTHYAWHPTAVTDALCLELYDIAKLGPTSANCSPMRVGFVRSAEGKARLLPLLSKGNRVKTEGAPIVAIIAQDRNYLDRIPELFPVGYDARSWFTQSEQSAQEHGLRNTMLQAAYLIIAARALGLDCGPMSGFEASAVDQAFFAGTAWSSQLLVNLGYGADGVSSPRKPRLAADEACRMF